MVEVGCTEETWWVVRRAEGNQHVPSNSALDAVQFLSTINTLPTTDAYLQYRLLEHLTSREWRSLLSCSAQPQVQELVTV
ncbi:hypothetical protein [Nostoc sp.]|uniref:hypothetical protein n=1 Tax=Nostoc sp. TaxID=1180 RepID=UPI002FF777D8